MPRKKSGKKIQLGTRLDVKLHKQLVEWAEQNEISLNSEIVRRLHDSFKTDQLMLLRWEISGLRNVITDMVLKKYSIK
jgi:hypothetical protein